MKINNLKELSKSIRERRKKVKLTQAQLAAASGVGVRFIVDLEKGKETCQLGKSLRIIKMLGLGIEILN